MIKAHKINSQVFNDIGKISPTNFSLHHQINMTGQVIYKNNVKNIK